MLAQELYPFTGGKEFDIVSAGRQRGATGTFVIALAASSLVIESNLIETIPMERKLFWIIFALLGLIADFVLPFWWAVVSTIPICWFSWWIAYRSDWF